MHYVEQPALEQLRFEDGARHPHDRLIGEERCAFGHRMHRTGEAHTAEVIEEIIAEETDLGEEGQLIRSEPQALDVLQRLLEACHQQETARGG